jgi:hypothetical protein
MAFWVVDDYTNPAKCAASIRTCQQERDIKLIAWFQADSHPQIFKDDFVKRDLLLRQEMKFG